MSKIFAVFFGMVVLAVPASAGIFDLPTFIEPGQWAVGLEPEIILSDGTGAGLNLKPRYGFNDILNVEGLIGAGTGSRGFRLGATADFDWFPDIENQPGIATPIFFEYYDLSSTGGLITFGARPLIYKTFRGKEADFTPFVSVPFGWGINSSRLNGFVQVAMGTVFKLQNIDKWRFTLETGFNAKNSYSYISGGVTYYH